MDLSGRNDEKCTERMRKRYEQQKIIQKMLEEYASDILNSDNFKSTEQHIQHGSVTVHRHCMDVAKYSLLLNKKLGLKCSQHDLIRGALLHDYFLYDWHDKEYLSQRKRLHGFWHPGIALKNAENEYELNDTQREIIKKHMWPLTIVPPKCREAWVVTVADKYCSLMETVGIHEGHGVQYPDEKAAE